ncbi:L-2,4-diaminobutyrate decarboxylase [Thalassoglobus neptunius]|uniref:L-2,4-diaminobutyrate decarboxylase n=1 Tax=Thalassoglobus neptunius TaxID=1938619 RepID=A0A5C5X6U6_9PLAN|nr:aminotransferase class I/II-fold pyridoxal phosphate-dependent enzyme [Thalassoglobus neptunius]TWT58837.1 L-2,4-diaminobutyrate decarboxylase [Thalassoglobus neptunius]
MVDNHSADHDTECLRVLGEALNHLSGGFADLPSTQSAENPDALSEILNNVAERMRDNFPYQHPFYLGQMLKPPHPVASLAYALAMAINPNNHAMDGGRASSQMEKEAVRQIARMVGWESALGHLCGGGTIANLEALWVAREVNQHAPVFASSQAHYTHERCCQLLGVPFHSVPCDNSGRMDVQRLEEMLDGSSQATIVVTLGTTGLGVVDPLDQVLELRDRVPCRIHVDAAYGGYFRLAKNLEPATKRQFSLMQEADSIVIDPHKHGLQPYGCGCVLFRDPAVARVYKHDSPYTYFTSDDLHLGEISFECSRPGASAVALWATLQRFPLTVDGEFAQGLESSRTAATLLSDWIDQSPDFVRIVDPELDIVVWSVAADSAKESSMLAERFFHEAAKRNVHLAMLQVPKALAEVARPDLKWDRDTLVCLRACLMKPEHQEWLPRILEVLDSCRRDLFQDRSH